MLSDLEFVVTNLRNLQGGRYKEAEENLYNSMRTDPHITRILLSKILSGHHEGSLMLMQIQSKCRQQVCSMPT